ncbi:Predicted inosine-uridine preferring nucleoside hydrolase [Phaffia rhodozyma]|uniref:Predicted inosine-uridine preferring nucleoside hydrolase n=1 Tax=Phaffia rhodozyma TaxID=264483 RepID=A0A0F7SRL5_PHARH|nr:Predicted inosine-uridine preferring nucleoside hydrolase [Phaffia rhodozyma]
MSKTIIDLDIGVDDALALIYALASSELDILALTPVFGNTTIEHVYKNLIKTFHVMERQLETVEPTLRETRWPGLVRAQRQKIQVSKEGARLPIDGEFATASYFHGPDGLSNISEIRPELIPPPSYFPASLELSSKASSDLILEVLEKEVANTVTIVALGPLTNLALAHKANPEIFTKVKQVVWMGAALDVPGNTSPSAEFNLYADPYAGAYIFDASSPSRSSHPFHLTILPLDVTTPHAVPFPELLLPSPESPVDVYTSAFLPRVKEIYSSLGLPDEMEMHDPMVVWVAVALARGDSGFSVRRRKFEVERKGEWTRGMCVIDRRGTEEADLAIRTHGGIKPKSSDEIKSDVSQSGIEVVVETTGKEAFRKEFMQRTFGRA